MCMFCNILAYGDEKKDFQCNQKYVLSCIEACYNSFNPIRHISYWEFQVSNLKTNLLK